MDFTSIVRSLSSSPYLAGRPFLTALFTALLGRLAYEGAVYPQGIARYTFGIAPLLAGSFTLPLWFISNLVLFLLLVLAVAEDRANRDADIREMFNGINTNVIKPGAGFLLTFGLVQGQSAQIMDFLGQLIPGPALLALAPSQVVSVASVATITSIEQAQVNSILSAIEGVLAIVWALIVAGSTWFVARIRNGIVASIAEFDENDSLGLMKLFHFAEASWTLVGIIMLVILPLLSLLLFGLTLLGLFLVQKWFDRREKNRKIPCPHCQTLIYPTALFCANCRLANPTPRNIGLFGQTKVIPVADLTAHRLNLIGRKRCPFCATRLKQSSAHQSCLACGTVTFGEISEVNLYLRALDKKLPGTLVICFLFSLIPLVGLVPGTIYYRLSLIASMRGYVPHGTGCLTRWGLRLATLVLVAFQFIPLIGALMLPLMCLLNYIVYRKVLHASALRSLAHPVSPSVAGIVPTAHHAAVVMPPAIPLGTVSVAVDVTSGRKFCATCGANRDTSAKFCVACGASFE